MENNSDKEIRDKLQSAEFPFDPKSWGQMESMLEEKRKPKGFFWWWFSGVAACLLLAGGMYGYHQFTNSNQNSKSTLTENISTSDKNLVAPGVKPESAVQNTNSSPVKTDDNNPTTALNKESNNGHSNQASHQSHISPVTGAAIPSKGEKTVTKASAARANKQWTKSPDNSSTASYNKAPARKIDGKLNANSASNVVSAHSKVPANGVLSENTSGMNNTIPSASKEMATQSEINAIKSNLPGAIDPLTMRCSGLTADEKTISDIVMKKDDDGVNLKKLKKKIFNYSLGVAANVTGSTLGRQPGATKAEAFYNTPSHMVGLTHDFMFFNRFAISNSILFSQTSFKVFNPNTADYLNSYSSNITELAIPIGVKGYIVSKPKFRFYMGVGFINHIKLKETFTYQYKDYNNNPVTSIGGTLPAQTQFGGTGFIEPAIYANSLSNAAYYNTSAYSVNQAKRYYTSFYATAGTEFIVQRHFVFFTEPLFYMALQKIGIQEKYKYQDLGLTAGFRYQF